MCCNIAPSIFQILSQFKIFKFYIIWRKIKARPHLKVWLNALTHCATVLCNACIYYCFSFGTGGWVRVLWNYPWVYCLFWYGVRHNMEMPYITLKLKKYILIVDFMLSLKRYTFQFFRAFTVRSPCVHKTFSVRSAFTYRSFRFLSFSFWTPEWKDRSLRFTAKL